MTPPVAVAIVSWNTRDFLVRALESFKPDADRGLVDMWVVDNASTDGSPDVVRERFPWVNLIASEENLGFGRAVNEVAKRTESEWIAPANSDIAAHPGAIERLLEAGAEDRKAGAVAPRLRLPDGSTQDSVGALPTIPFSALHAVGALRLQSRGSPTATRIPSAGTRSGAGTSRGPSPPSSWCGARPGTRSAGSTSASGCTPRTSTSAGASSRPAGPPCTCRRRWSTTRLPRRRRSTSGRSSPRSGSGRPTAASPGGASSRYARVIAFINMLGAARRYPGVAWRSRKRADPASIRALHRRWIRVHASALNPRERLDERR